MTKDEILYSNQTVTKQLFEHSINKNLPIYQRIN